MTRLILIFQLALVDAICPCLFAFAKMARGFERGQQSTNPFFLLELDCSIAPMRGLLRGGR